MAYLPAAAVGLGYPSSPASGYPNSTPPAPGSAAAPSPSSNQTPAVAYPSPAAAPGYSAQTTIPNPADSGRSAAPAERKHKLSPMVIAATVLLSIGGASAIGALSCYLVDRKRKQRNGEASQTKQPQSQAKQAELNELEKRAKTARTFDIDARAGTTPQIPVLRAFTHDDAAHFAQRMQQDPEGRAKYFSAPNISRADIEASFNDVPEARKTLEHNGKPVAMINVHFPKEPSAEPHIGFYVDKDARKHRYGTIACREAIDGLFKNPDIREVVACVKNSNTPSMKLLTSKLGFTPYAGVHRDVHYGVYKGCDEKFKILSVKRDGFSKAVKALDAPRRSWGEFFRLSTLPHQSR